MSDEPAGGRLRFAGLVAAAVLLLTAPRLLLHELWRDEAWLWVVVTESRSLSDLFVPLARSGQGYLFPLLCYLARQVSTSPLAMQALHLLLVGTAAFVFAGWAPFGRRERALFVLGYFPFYEYAVLSRHYVLGALLLWLACAAVRGRRPVLLGAALGLICQTTVYGFILALAVACAAAGEWFPLQNLRDPRDLKDSRDGLSWAGVAVGAVLALAGGIAGLVQLIPLPGTSFAPEWHFGWEPAQALKVLAMPWRAFVPLPLLKVQFWNTNLLDASPGLQAAAGVLVLALAIALLWRRKGALATFCLGTAGILAFGYVKYVGVMRHQGHEWLLFAAALWLSGAPFLRQEGRRSWRSRVLLALLLVHLFAGAWASWMDLRHPFSNGAATADLIRAEGLDRHPLLGHREPPAATVSLALGKPLFSPSRGQFVTYPDCGPEQREMSDPELRCAARNLARREGGDIVLVINRKLPPWEELDPAGSRTGAIQSSEDYHLYRLRHGRLAATAAAAQCANESP
ncbi:MAG TPA: hypothetical protein VHN15_09000 [Thermoanaerobaculia bacterium]|nr:hypothetical protein [Thermoanaerobaculia bacterium]